MKLWTPHLLLRRFRGESHLSQRRLDDAVARARKEGWAFAYHPHSDEPGRPVLGVREGDLLHGIYERTYSASRVDRLGHAMVGRATLEGLVGMSLVWPDCGKRLGQRGLLLFHAQGKTTYVLGANPELAVAVNALRYGTPDRGVHSAKLIKAVLGLPRQPARRLGDERLYDAAEQLHWLAVEAHCLFDRTPRCCPRSRWHVEDTVRDPITDLPAFDGDDAKEVA